MNAAPLALLAGLAAGLGVIALVEVAFRSGSLRSWLVIELEPLRKSIGEGRTPTSAERVRIAIVLGLGATVAGWVIGDFPLALLAAVSTPIGTVTLLAGSKRRYRRRVERALPDVARAVADGLAAGRSPRGALGSVHRSLEGEAGTEFTRVGREIALGQPTSEVLDGLAARLDSDRTDAFAVAITSHRTTGGDLADLLRRFAEGAAERDRVADDARSSTAQARFSGYLVAAMPLAAGLLVEVGSPGLFRSVVGSTPALILVGLSAAIQLAGFLAISRLATVPEG